MCFRFKRLTYITGFSKQASIEGDVIYVAPCGKRLKNSQDLIKVTMKEYLSIFLHSIYLFFFLVSYQKRH